MLVVEILKIFAAALTALAAITAVFGETTTRENRLNRKGRRLIIIAIAGFVCAVSIQVFQYLRLLESSETLRRRHQAVLGAVEQVREGADSIRAETSRLSETASRIAWEASLDPIPISELHLQCDFDGCIEESVLNREGALEIVFEVYRSHQGILLIMVSPRTDTGSDQPVGTLNVFEPGRRAQNIKIRQRELTEYLDSEPYRLWITLLIDEVRDSAAFQGVASWPLPTIGHLRRAPAWGRVSGSLQNRVCGLSLMINRELLVDIPLEQVEDRLEGEVADAFSVLRERRYGGDKE